MAEPFETNGESGAGRQVSRRARAISLVVYAVIALFSAAFLETMVRLDFWPDISAAPGALVGAALRLLPLGLLLALLGLIVGVVLLPAMRFIATGIGPNGRALRHLRAGLRSRYKRDRSEAEYARAEGTLLALMFAAILLIVILFGGYAASYFGNYFGAAGAVVAALFCGWLVRSLAPTSPSLRSALISGGFFGLLIVIVAHVVRLP